MAMTVRGAATAMTMMEVIVKGDVGKESEGCGSDVDKGQRSFDSNGGKELGKGEGERDIGRKKREESSGRRGKK